MLYTERAITPRKEKSKDERLEEAFDRYFSGHMKDVRTHSSGDKKAIAELAGTSFGARNVRVDRCAPELFIEKIQLDTGKQLVLIGPNGSGKTTVFDAIMESRDAHMSERSGQGAVVYGKSVHQKEDIRISRLNQEEMLAGLHGLHVSEVLAFAQKKFAEQFPVDWENGDVYDQNIINQDAQMRIEELRGRLNQLFDMEEFQKRSVEELSGGERTKLSLSMILLSEPDILLLDEPTNHLDLESLSKLSGLLQSYAANGVAILSVSHVDAFLQNAGTDGVLEIDVEEKERRVTQSNRPYATYVKDRSREHFTIVSGNIEWPEARGAKGGALVTPLSEHISIPNSPINDVKIDSFLPGAVWVFSGNNGSGKTKLMEAMATREKGRGIFDRSKGTSIAYLPQFWPDEVLKGTLGDFFEWVKSTTDRLAEATSKRYIEAINTIGFEHYENGKRDTRNLLRKPLAAFSGGEQRLLWFIAVSVLPKVDALLLDEPTNHMDRKVQALVTKAIQDFPGAIIFSTHDMQLLATISKDVGKKGGTMEPKNFALEKKNGKTSIRVSRENPFDFIKDKLERAKKAGGRVKI